MSKALEVQSAKPLPDSLAPLTSLDWLFKALIYLSFLLMLVVPTTIQQIRAPILLLAMMGVLLAILKGRWRVHREIAILFFLCIAVSLCGMLRGMVSDGPGATRVGTVYVLWPIVFMSFVGLINKPSDLKVFFKIIIIGCLVSALMGLWVVLEVFGYGVPGGLEFLRSQGAGVGLHDGVVEYSLYNISTLIFGFPFLVALLFMPPSASVLDGAWRYIAWVVLFAIACTVLISGRRSFWLVSALSPIIVIFFMVVSRIPVGHVVVRLPILFAFGAAIVIGSVLVLDIRLLSLIESFVAGFDFSGGADAAASIRGDQFVDLIDGWSNHPLIGAGHGTSAPSVVRSVESPWAYELSYVALLYQVGLIGTAIYAMSIVWLAWVSVQHLRGVPADAEYVVPILAGLSCFLIANATNPYLVKFDHLWTVFILVAAVNACLAAKR